MKTLRPTLRAALFLFAIFTVLHPDGASAQPAGAEITGEVRDPQGAVVAGGSISAIETQTGLTLTTVTAPTGTYTLTKLRPGVYRLGVEAIGFKRLVREGINLATGERVRIDVAFRCLATSISASQA